MKTRILTLTGMVLLTTVTMANAAHHREMNASAASGHENKAITENSELANSAPATMTISLEEWISGRESWEQEGAELATSNFAEASLTLEEWVAGRDNWEQESAEMTAIPAGATAMILEDWSISRNNWEQK